MLTREKLLHPATVISCVALFITLGGVGYAAATIGTADIQNSAVTQPKIRAGAVTNSRLGAKSVTTSKLNTNAVINSKIAANAVQADQIAPNSITAGDIQDGQVIEGRGTQIAQHLVIGAGATNTVLASFPNLGALRISCAAGVGTTNFQNTSGTSINVRYWGVNNGAPDTPVIASSNPANQGVITAANTGTGGIQGLTWQVGYTDAAQVQHVAQIHVSLNNAGGSCVVDFQASYTG